MWLKQEYCTHKPKQPSGMNGNMSVCCSAFGFIYFDIIQTLCNVFTYLNYNAWKKEIQGKSCLFRGFVREKLELEARREKKVAWLNASSLPLTAPKRKFKTKLWPSWWQWAIDLSSYGSSLRQLRGGGDPCCWVYVSWLPLKENDG